MRKPAGGLTKWFKEDWRDVKTGKKCGRSGKEKKSRPYPACRPANVASKISKNEPESPGIVIPQILINPQKKIKTIFLFSYRGSLTLKIITNTNPKIRNRADCKFVLSFLLTKI